MITFAFPIDILLEAKIRNLSRLFRKVPTMRIFQVEMQTADPLSTLLKTELQWYKTSLGNICIPSY